MRSVFFILGSSLAFFLSSCSQYVSESGFDSLSLRMDKDDVIKKMKGQGVARCSTINKHGQSIEVREYKTKDWWSGYETIYWLYFCNGTLVQWGRAGDWAEAKKSVYDINFSTNQGG